MKQLQHIIIYCLSSCSLALTAGELMLTNGDLIHGELIAINATDITWASSLFGNITVPKNNIVQLDSSTMLNLELLPSPTLELTTTQIPEITDLCTLKVEGDTESVSARCQSLALDEHALNQLSLDNIVSIKAQPKTPPFSGTTTLGFNKRSGNTDKEELDIEVALRWQRGLFSHEVDILIDNDKKNDVVIEENYNTSYQLNYDLNEHWFSYGRAEYEKDRFSGIDEQYQIGTGIGRKIFFHNQLRMNVQLGADYWTTKRKSSDSNDKSTDHDIAGRWALKLDWPVPDSSLTLFHRQELIWLLEEPDDNQLKTSTGIKMPLIGGIFSEIKYKFDHLGKPSSGDKHADQEWAISLGYEW